MIKRTYLSDDSWIDVFKLPHIEYKFDEISNLRPEEKVMIMMYGKLIPAPRYQQGYFQDYIFSGKTHKSKDLPDIIKPFLEFANESKYTTKYDFNEILINWYTNGHDYIGSHSDNETQLISGSPVLAISLGQTRTFRIRDKKTKEIVEDFYLEDGTVCVMGGKCQKEFKHEIVKVNGMKGEKLEERISISFRKFKKIKKIIKLERKKI